MKRPHPKRSRANTFVGTFVLIVAGGCHNQQTALTNPFMAPDRVPPPSTRAVAPGTAQPYYPGDPLPATHADASAPIPPVAASLATPTPAPTTNAAGAATKSSGPLAFSNERTVSVPTDSNELRFSLPPPVEVATTTQPQPAPAAQAPAAIPGPASALQTVAQNTRPTVTPASYTIADAYQPPAANTADPSPTGGWRAPQVPGATVAANTGNPWIGPYQAPYQTPATAPQQAATVAGPSVPVTMRAVPSPTMDTAGSDPPRIRFPSYDTTPQMVAANGTPQPTGLVAPPGSIQAQGAANSPWPAPNAVPGLGPAAVPPVSVATQPQPPTVVSPDGFRPRSIMR
jgi:hypothetical protein